MSSTTPVAQSTSPPHLEADHNSSSPPPAAPPPRPPALSAMGSTRKACDACRLSKSRCEAAAPNDAVCTRCKKTGRKCVFGERSRRRKRAKTDSDDEAGAESGTGGRDKVSRLEKKVSILEARLGAGGESGATRDGGDDDAERFRTPPASSTAPPPPRLSPVDVPPHHLTNPLYFFTDRMQRKGTVKPSGPAPPDVLARQVLTLATATTLYTHFVTSMLPHLPFFAAPSSLSLWREEKPLLFLTMLSAAAASSGASELHATLLEEVYATLAARILHSGDKNLELVQAIITTVTWYHPPASIDQSRLWMLTMQAAAMAVELDLGVATDLDAVRALLVCYYCNACISVVLRRPLFLRWGRRIEDALERLKGGRDGDRVLEVYIRLVRHVEEAVCACGALDGGRINISGASLAWALATAEKRVTTTWAEAERTSSAWGLARTSLDIAHHGAILQVFSVIFEASSADVGLLSANASLLSTAHRTLDAFLATPAENLRCAPFHVFSRAANACSALICFAARERKAENPIEHLKLPYYLETLISRLRRLLASGGGSKTMAMSLALADGMRLYYRANLAPPAKEEEEHEEEAVAAAEILCGTPAASVATFPAVAPPPVVQHQFHPPGAGLSPSAGYSMPTPPDHHQQPQHQHQPQQQGIFSEPMAYEQTTAMTSQALDAFLAGVDAQFMMGGIGALGSDPGFPGFGLGNETGAWGGSNGNGGTWGVWGGNGNSGGSGNSNGGQGFAWV